MTRTPESTCNDIAVLIDTLYADVEGLALCDLDGLLAGLVHDDDPRRQHAGLAKVPVARVHQARTVAHHTLTIEDVIIKLTLQTFN